MRIMPIVRYFWGRHRLGILIYCAFTFAALLISLSFMVSNTQMIVDVSDQGVIEVMEVTDAYSNRFWVSASLNFDLTTIIAILALLLIQKNRELLTTFSVTRYEQIIAGYVYIILMSLMLALLGNFIMPALIRAIMALLDVRVRGGWTAMTVLTGNQDDFIKALYDTFIFMIALGGLYTLLGYIAIRWWKVILIAAGAAVVGGIVMFSQYSTARLTMFIIDNIQAIVRYILDVVVPFVDRVLDNGDTLLYTLRYVGFSLLCMAVSYPVMRRIPLR